VYTSPCRHDTLLRQLELIYAYRYTRTYQCLTAVVSNISYYSYLLNINY